MAIAQHLEDFSKQKLAPSDPSADSLREDLEDQKLASFEEGYSAGWDDAIQAQEKRAGFLNETLVKCVENFAIGLEDVQKKHRDASVSLNCQILSKLLAVPTDSYFPKAIAAQIADLATASDTVSLEILAAQDQIGCIERILPDFDGVYVSCDPSLTPGTARISIKRNEFEMNIEQVIQEIAEILSSCHDEASVEV